MAVSNKGSRKIVLENNEFRWKATIDYKKINIIIWHLENKNLKIIGFFDSDDKINLTNSFDETNVIITNRVIKVILEHLGVSEVVSKNAQINLGRLNDIYNINNALKMEDINK